MTLNVKRVLFSLFLVGLCFIGKEPCFFVTSLAVGGEANSIPASTAVAAEKKSEQKQESSTITAFYFHGNFRCSNCRKIEQYSREAIEKYFAEELKTKKLAFIIINTDMPENKHFVEDYQLYTRSLIIAEFKEGMQVRWKNLTKVWNHLNDKEKFYEYVKAEIQQYLEQN